MDEPFTRKDVAEWLEENMDNVRSVNIHIIKHAGGSISRTFE